MATFNFSIIELNWIQIQDWKGFLEGEREGGRDMEGNRIRTIFRDTDNNLN